MINNFDVVDKAAALEKLDWKTVLPPQKLQPHKRHFYFTLEKHAPLSYVRILARPDGGISRVRLYGFPSGVDNNAV